MFIDHRQEDWPEWLVTAEFVVNNKVHTATKISPFMANYGRELSVKIAEDGLHFYFSSFFSFIFFIFILYF